MKRILRVVIPFFLLVTGVVFAQNNPSSVAQDNQHTIKISNNSSMAISVQDAGGHCMDGQVLQPVITAGQQNAWPIQVNAVFCAIGSAHHLFELFDQNGNSLGYVGVWRSGERFSTGVVPPTGTSSVSVMLNQTGDEWAFTINKK